MSPEVIQIGIALLSIACGVLGWWAKTMWNRIDGLDSRVNQVGKDLSTFREEVPQKYASHSRMEYVLDRIDTKLDRLFERIDDKVDKP